MVEHKLKTLPVYWDAVQRGEKNFEVRLDDRGFQKGDVLVLQRMNEGSGFRNQVEYDLRGKVRFELRKRIAYVLTGGKFGIEPDYVVLALVDEEA